MRIEAVTQEVVSEFFLEDKMLCWIGLCDEDLVYLYENKAYPQFSDVIFLGVFNEEELVALVRMDKFSSIATWINIYVSSALHGTGTSIEVAKAVEHHIRDNTKYTKILVTTPSTCTHSQKYVSKLGFKKEAVIKDAIVWRQDTVDLFWYGANIDRNKQ